VHGPMSRWCGLSQPVLEVSLMRLAGCSSDVRFWELGSHAAKRYTSLPHTMQTLALNMPRILPLRAFTCRCYYDPKRRLFGDAVSGQWYTYDAEHGYQLAPT